MACSGSTDSMLQTDMANKADESNFEGSFDSLMNLLLVQVNEALALYDNSGDGKLDEEPSLKRVPVESCPHRCLLGSGSGTFCTQPVVLARKWSSRLR